MKIWNLVIFELTKVPRHSKSLWQVSSYDFEPTFIICFVIRRVLPDQPKYKQITKPLTRNKHLSLLYFWVRLILILHERTEKSYTAWENWKVLSYMRNTKSLIRNVEDYNVCPIAVKSRISSDIFCLNWRFWFKQLKVLTWLEKWIIPTVLKSFFWQRLLYELA